MTLTTRYVAVAIFLIAFGTASLAAQRNSVVIVLKDGHQRTFSISDGMRIEFKNPGTMTVTQGSRQESIPVADISRIDFNASNALQVGRNHFLGKWKVGSGAGEDFYITLEPDGRATKTIGASHGTWVVVDGEARISWDDGWHDVIRKVGDRHEKVAYEPGKSFNDQPNNVTDAKNVTGKPI